MQSEDHMGSNIVVNECMWVNQLLDVAHEERIACGNRIYQFFNISSKKYFTSALALSNRYVWRKGEIHIDNTTQTVSVRTSHFARFQKCREETAHLVHTPLLVLQSNGNLTDKSDQLKQWLLNTINIHTTPTTLYTTHTTHFNKSVVTKLNIGSSTKCL
jgi:hypothetical protein